MKSYTLPGLVLLIMILSACGSGGLTPHPAQPTSADMLFGKATVEEVSILLMESFPLQVRVVAKGYLADSCTTIDKLTVNDVEAGFRVEIITARPAQELCAQITQPFEQSIPLDVYGLPAGDYTVEVNGVEAEFTFTQDNILPGGG